MLVLVSTANWVSGWSIYWLCYIVGLCGICFIVSSLDSRVVRWVLIGGMISQMYFRYVGIPGMDWEIEIDDHLGGWGTVRHAIRYSTIVFVGILALIKELDTSKRVYIKIACGVLICFGLFSMVGAYSNALIAIMIIILYTYLVKYLGYRKFWSVPIPAWFALVGVLLFLLLKPNGFELDSGRIALWSECWHSITESANTFFLGHGTHSYNLFVNTAHPHNEYLALWYDFGFIGLFFILGIIGLIICMSFGEMWLLMALIGILISFGTNSVRYPDMSILLAILSGLAVKHADS